ncbi:MAG: hypothetical protein WD826_00640 [Actinomycetota bacterium]
MTVGDVLRFVAAIASFGAGLIHVSAATAHREHALVGGFFIVVGIAQLAWGGAVIAYLRSRRLLDLGGLMSVAVIATWIVSRTTGISFIEGAEHAEPVEIKDAIAAILELSIVGIAIGGALRPRMMRLLVSSRSAAPLAVATALLIVPGVMLPAHHHVEHSHIADTRDLAAARHDEAATHEVTSDDHETAEATHGHAKATTEAAHTHPPVESKAAHVEDHDPVETLESITAKVKYGPFVLPPAGLGGEAHYNRVLTNVAKPCTNCYIVEAKPNLVNENGTSANLDTGAMLHHAVWTRPSIDDTTCGRSSAIGSQGERFFASGNERTEFVLPAGFGYPVGTDAWNLIVEVMNHSQQSRTVYISLAVEYLPLSADIDPVTPVWMDVDNCADSQYAIPAGETHTTWDWTSKVTGRIVAAGGHVHDGGVKTVFRNESMDKDVCTSVAGYGSDPAFDGSIESMSFCSWDRIGAVKKGEVLGLHAYYDSTEAQDDVMGIVVAYVFETSDLAGGTTYTGKPPAEPDPPPPHDH